MQLCFSVITLEKTFLVTLTVCTCFQKNICNTWWLTPAARTWFWPLGLHETFRPGEIQWAYVPVQSCGYRLVWYGSGSAFSRGLYFGPKTIFIPPPPPLLKMIFFPLLRHIVFWLPLRPFRLNSSLFCNYFTLLLPLFPFSFPFLSFSFPVPLSSFSFYIFPLFLFAFSYFFPQVTSTDIPPPGGGGYFRILGPWPFHFYYFISLWIRSCCV